MVFESKFVSPEEMCQIKDNDWLISSEDARRKTALLQIKLLDFEEAVRGMRQYYIPEFAEIYYSDGMGYILRSKRSDGTLEIRSFGSEFCGAFLNVLVDYEKRVYEKLGRVEKEKFQEYFHNRFSELGYDEYNGTVVSIEFALHDFRKYFGLMLPAVIVDYYNNCLLESNYPFKYSIDTGKLEHYQNGENNAFLKVNKLI